MILFARMSVRMTSSRPPCRVFTSTTRVDGPWTRSLYGPCWTDEPCRHFERSCDENDFVALPSLRLWLQPCTSVFSSVIDEHLAVLRGFGLNLLHFTCLSHSARPRLNVVFDIYRCLRHSGGAKCREMMAVGIMSAQNGGIIAHPRRQLNYTLPHNNDALVISPQGVPKNPLPQTRDHTSVKS